MSDPKRIQRKRTKGWRMPEGARYVGRGTAWGNPFNATQIAACFHMRGYPKPLVKLHTERGKDLACWCPLDRLCHADVLLRLANRSEPFQ